MLPELTVSVNGAKQAAFASRDTSLLFVLRNELKLTGRGWAAGRPSASFLCKREAFSIALICPLMFILLFASMGMRPAAAQENARLDAKSAEPTPLLLKDYDPKSMLHAAVHESPRAKFPVIDVHSHVDDAYGDPREYIAPAEVIRRMDRANVETIVILTGLWGDKLQGVIDKMVRPYPDRFLVFTQIDWSKIDDPNFSAEMVTQIDDAVRRGARGLKILPDLGSDVKDKTGHLIPVDDLRLDPIWEECGRLGIPVAIHTGNPDAFFSPLDRHNERYEELSEIPNWAPPGPQFPTKGKLLAERNHVIEKHPHTTFIALHVANWAENLDAVSQWLDKYPNMYVEFGAAQAELGRQPRRARKFFIDYQDRILFGTDFDPLEQTYATFCRWLETADEYFPYAASYPKQGRWMIYGMELPDDVLENVYHKNADGIFAQFKAVR